MRGSAGLTALTLGLLGVCHVTGDPVNFSFKTIDAPGARYTTANGINNLGQIVGAAGLHGFLNTNRVFTFFNVDGMGVATSAQGINDRGQIVAQEGDSSFLFSRGTFAPILIPGALMFANSINNAGQIVGYYNPGGPSQGFLDTNGVFATVDVPGAFATFAQGVSNTGQIVGFFLEKSGLSHGFLYANETFTTIDVPGALLTTASAINRSGQIVGEFVDSTGAQHGFLDTAGVFTIIAVPGAPFTNPFDINDAGQIVGDFGDTTDSGHEHGFLATPVPEPASVLLFVSGLPGVGAAIQLIAGSQKA